MSKLTSYVLIAIYGLFNLLGHAGLHAILGDKCSSDVCASRSCGVVKDGGDVIFASGTYSKSCRHQCCNHVHVSSKNKVKSEAQNSVQLQYIGDSNEEPAHEDSEHHECELGLYFAQSQMEVFHPALIVQLFELESKVLATSQRLGLVMCVSYDVRGPPVAC